MPVPRGAGCAGQTLRPDGHVRQSVPQDLIAECATRGRCRPAAAGAPVERWSTRYTYEASDRWRDGCLIISRVAVNDDGKVSPVEAMLDDDRLKVTGPGGPASMPPEVFPTHHWNAGVLGSDAVLNTITGRLDSVQIIRRGEEMVPVNGTMAPATRYAYTGALTNEVWYDSQGRWVKMEFSDKSGATISYVCKSCRGNVTASQ
ncbi:MAG: hypothetical protein IPK78_16500 [Rhodospirillales bacterium]|nr:hypothetical protein [Rhodospirillales bacterium]